MKSASVGMVEMEPTAETAEMGVMDLRGHQDRQGRQDRQDHQDRQGIQDSQAGKPFPSSIPSHMPSKRLHQVTQSALTHALLHQNPATTSSPILFSTVIRVRLQST